MSRFDKYTVVRNFLTRDMDGVPITTPVVWILDKATGQALANIKTLSPVRHFSEQGRHDYRAFLINGHQLNFTDLGKPALFDEITLSDAIRAVTEVDLLARLRETQTCQLILRDQGETFLLADDGYGYTLRRGPDAGRETRQSFKIEDAHRILQTIRDGADRLRFDADQLFEPFEINRVELVYNNPAIKILLDGRAA